MSATTTAPGGWQLPGGNVEPLAAGLTLDETELRRQACKELAEEIGVHAAPEDLALWPVTRGEHGNIGVHYQAPPPQAQWIGRIIAVSRGESGEGC
ncbi:NUDIX hydrolase [Kitasatospora cathayae]|uniref:NUDIX domain-containing protein n=1 Tax=Kitasatospora cathayae TaxID=3004092 RepID=A0ABY7Q1M8_9ACTN|nr:NUDIX domain-containing protein [Kitasatospora sp. HUAS 3-15]WBP86531.1 NUDIX domain-containing protein [Kitasatospora sp. HUAS 3-15]